MVPTGRIFSYQGHVPKIDPTSFVAPGSHIIGDVTLEARVHVLFSCIIRGDGAPIRVGEGSNIQDNSTLHGDRANPAANLPPIPCIIGKNVSIGHNCLLHGCEVEDDVLIGMGAVVMSRARIGTGSIIATGAVVLEDTVVPPYSLIVGQPGKIKRTYDPEVVLPRIRRIAEGYQERMLRFKESLREVPYPKV